MKTLLILISFLFLRPTCYEQTTKNMENILMEYEFYSRASYSKILINNQTIKLYKTREALQPNFEKHISLVDQEKLSKLFSKINLETIYTLKDPTQKRFYDGAAIAILRIKVQKKEYQSTNFDHGNPPNEIKQLVDKINEIAEK